MNTAKSNTSRIVIVGGGVAGLLIATRLGQRLGQRARITLVDRGWTHVWKPMLHTFAAGTWSVHQQQVPYLLHARARSISPCARCASPSRMPFPS